MAVQRSRFAIFAAWTHAYDVFADGPLEGYFMRCIRIAAAFIPLFGLAACVSNEQFLASNQAAATKVASSRAAFELNCQAVTPMILSSKVIETRFGYSRTEYTIGVSGCGKRAVYLAYCLDANNCNAINDSSRGFEQ